jgi:O-antigen/teichoic acid export membrane protein
VLQHRLFVNSASIFGGEAVARLATSLMALVIARSYGPAALGEYAYALALASVLLLVPDFGLHLFAVRELAVAPARLSEIFWGVHWLKLALAGVVVVSSAWISGWGMASGGQDVFYLLVGRAILQTFSQASMAVFKAFERMQYVALQQAVNSFVVVLWVGTALVFRAPLPVVVMGLVAGQFVETCLGWCIIRNRFTPGLPRKWDGRLLSTIAHACFPIGITAVLLAVNLRIDILVLRIYVRTGALGQFHVAASFAILTFLATSLLMAVLFPKLSRLLIEGSTRGSSYVLSLLKNGLLVTALASLALWISAPLLVPLFFGQEFTPAVSTLRILAPALPLVFLNTVLFYVFVAARRRFVYMGTLAFGVAAGAALCLYLAPRYGAAGCAIADVIRELIVSGIYLYFLANGAHARIAGRALLKVFAAATVVLIPGALVTSAFFRDMWLAAWMFLVIAGTLLFLGRPRRTEWRLLTDEHL